MGRQDEIKSLPPGKRTLKVSTPLEMQVTSSIDALGGSEMKFQKQKKLESICFPEMKSMLVTHFLSPSLLLLVPFSLEWMLWIKARWSIY